MIAAILLNPKLHAGKVYPLYGPVEMTQIEVAEAISKVLGRKITYQAITLENFREGVEHAFHRPFLTQHLYEVAKDHANGIFAGTNDVIPSITGRPGMTVEDFVKANIGEFNTSE